MIIRGQVSLELHGRVVLLAACLLRRVEEQRSG